MKDRMDMVTFWYLHMLCLPHCEIGKSGMKASVDYQQSLGCSSIMFERSIQQSIKLQTAELSRSFCMPRVDAVEVKKVWHSAKRYA